MLNGLDLFSGIGGITLALKPWVRPVAYCENERYAQAVLLSRMRSGELPTAPIWDDVRTLRGDTLGNWIDIVYGGFPCQDISVAGHGEGLAGVKSGLFFELLRIVSEVRPSFVFLENVPAIRTRGLSRVCFELASLGYSMRWTTVSAAEVGAGHKRRRWFLLAHANRQALRVEQGWGNGESGPIPPLDTSDGDAWLAAWASEGAFKPNVSRAGDGIPFAVDRDRGLGNGVVPQAARRAYRKLAGF